MRGDPVYNETRMEIKEKERKRKEGEKNTTHLIGSKIFRGKVRKGK